MLLAGIGSYSVEQTGNDVDQRLSAMEAGEQMTFGELIGVEACTEVRYVGPYTSNGRKRELIGNARVDLEKTDRFAVLVAYDEDEVVRAVKVAWRVELLASQPCDAIFTR